MAYTRAQWEALQNRLPEEDRVSYDEYLRSIGRTFASPTPTAAKESGTIGATSISTQTPQSAKDAAAREGNLSQEDLAQIAAALANMQAQEKAGDDALKNALTGLNVIPGFDPNAFVTPPNTTTPNTTKVDTKADPGKQPGTAWVLSADGASWVQPPKPNDGEYDWDDNKGWIKKTTPSTDPGKQPGKAWVLSSDGKSWVQPPKPADGEYTWNDDTGWVKKVTPGTDPGQKPGVAWVLSADGKSWVKPPMPTDGTYEWNDSTGWVKKTTPNTNPTPTVVDTQIIGSGTNRVIRTYYSNGTYIDTPAPETIVNTATADSGMAAALAALKAQNEALLAQMQAAALQASLDAKAAAEAAAKEKQENAIAVLTDRFTRYGLASLVPKIRELAISGASESTITLQLQETEEYKQRFSANQDRIKKGLAVLDPGTYLGLEDRYRQILRAYGLKQFDNDSYVSQFLSNDISPEELSSRVVNAVQRVQNADPAVSAMLREYYNIGTTDMVAYVLDVQQQHQFRLRQSGVQS